MGVSRGRFAGSSPAPGPPAGSVTVGYVPDNSAPYRVEKRLSGAKGYSKENYIKRMNEKTNHSRYRLTAGVSRPE